MGSVLAMIGLSIGLVIAVVILYVAVGIIERLIDCTTQYILNLIHR